MPDSVQRLILDMVQNSPHPLKTIAEMVGKPYSTLMRELDPFDQRAKLGVELLLPLMLACNSVAPMRYMATAMGYRMSSTREIRPEKASFHEELLDTYQALVDYHRSMLEEQPQEVVAKHSEVLIRQIKEDFVAYMDQVKGRGRTQNP